MSGIKDVARLADVSISTVSRVLNDSCPVAEEKRRRVEKAVRELNYVPNPAARSLLLRKTGTLGVVIPFASGEFFSEFLTGVDQTASDCDYFLLISISHRSEGDLTEAIRNLEKRVDGLVVWAPEMKAERVRRLVGEATPLLMVNTSEPDTSSDFIDFDNYGGMSQIVSYLLDIGHRDIAFVGGPLSASDAQDRLRAYRDTLSASGIEARPEMEFEGRFRFEDGYLAAQEILDMPKRPTAIVASNDQTAFGVLTALREQEVRVPADISVTGFDDVPSASYYPPPLTTVRVPVRYLGEVAIDTMVSRLSSKSLRSPLRRTLDVELVVRESTAPPSAKSQ